jgi:hypothetical protein
LWVQRNRTLLFFCGASAAATGHAPLFGAGEQAIGGLADRDDRTMHLFSRPVEEQKGGSNFERGKLLSPEAFELPLERGVAPLPPQEEQTIGAQPIPPRAVLR